MGLWHKMQPYRNNIPASGEAYIRARTAARVARGLPCTK